MSDNRTTLTVCAHVLKVYLITRCSLTCMHIYLSVSLFFSLREQAFPCLAYSGFIAMSLLFLSFVVFHCSMRHCKHIFLASE